MKDYNRSSQTNRINEVSLELRKHDQETDTYAISIVGEEPTIISVLNNDEVKRMEKNIEDKNSFIKIGESYFKDCMIISIIRIN